MRLSGFSQWLYAQTYLRMRKKAIATELAASTLGALSRSEFRKVMGNYHVETMNFPPTHFVLVDARSGRFVNSLEILYNESGRVVGFTDGTTAN